MPIAPTEMEDQDSQGSVGFFLHESKDNHGNHNNKILAVTNHYVVYLRFPPVQCGLTEI